MQKRLLELEGDHMAGSGFGTIFRITTWGESHGPALGVTIDGCPAGLPLAEEDLRPFMERRRPNAGPLSTKRSEADQAEILSGVFEGKTTGTPISILIRNTDQRSRDYSDIADVIRPGHADYTYDCKYGFRDYRGGGRSSGRETAARVAAGAVASKLLASCGITFDTYLSAVGGIPVPDEYREDPVSCPEIAALLNEMRENGDSIGSEVCCRITGVPSGLGDPVFEKLDAKLAAAVFSIGAVKALEIGSGIDSSRMRGSQFNDAFVLSEEGNITKETNHAGGILGGISDGSDILLHVFFKPTPSISASQKTVKGAAENTQISIRGRHDPLIGARAAVVVETMSALVLADALLINMTSRVDSVIRFYKS